MIGIFIIAGLLFLATLLLFLPLRIRFYFVGAKKDSLIEIRFFRWTFFSTKEDLPTEEKSNYKSETHEAFGRSTPESSFDSSVPEDNSESDIETNTESETHEAFGRSTPESSFDSSVPEDNSESDIETNTKSETHEAFASKKTRPLSEKEFLTLMFNPKLHSMVLRMAWRLLRRTWRLFKIRFEHVVVQGIRMEYDEMGVVAAISSFFTSQVDFFKNWDIQMDWLKEKNPEIRGTLLIQFRLFFFLLWSLMALFYVARVYFWYRRNKKRFIENPLPFRLVFWRRKIVDLLAAED